MKQLLIAAWLALGPLAAANAAIAAKATRTAAPAPTTFDVAAIDAYVAAQAQEYGMVGLSLAIVRNGEVVLAKGYGQSSIERREPVTTNTLFAIGSISKQFTCACILLLAEEGKLSVHDKVAKYFPDLTRAGDITLLDLMTHLSGYPDYYPLDFLDRRMMSPIKIDELIAQYAGGRLDFEPGTKWSYSNTGYVILGRVIEKVSGQTFERFLEQRILEPLALKQTLAKARPGQPGCAQGYTGFALSPPTAAAPEAEGWIFSAGSMYSTALDLARWDLALIQAKVLKPASYELMTASRPLANGKLSGYGCGLGVALREGFLVLAHSGAVNGFAARNATVPATKSAVIMLCNSDSGGGFAKLHSTVLSLLLQTPTSVPKIAGPPASEAAKDFFRRLQTNKINRRELGDEFSIFLDEEKIRGAAARLSRLGKPTLVEVEDLRERGGMEVAAIRFGFPSGALRALMYRTPDGRIQEFLIDRE